MKVRLNDAMFLAVLSVGVILIASFGSLTHAGLANAEQNKTLMKPQEVQSTTANATKMSIVLVHGAWADGSGWSKVIPILTAAGHKVIAVQLPLHSLADDVATVKRAIQHIGGPTILVGHSYGGEVITNGYNNPNVKGLVYIAAFAPEEGQGEFSFINPAKFPKGLLITDSEGFIYLNPQLFRENFAQDVFPG